uniref:Uncharacterized protein n=1 Tax=Cereibacter sphaeroides (strain ATCC 17025 / ATH 2.4.3) TaxID=349102 RepID=A4WQQ1_CERS5
MKRSIQYLTDPLWRPLVELEINGATSYEGALMLAGAGLVTSVSFVARSGRERGRSVPFVDFTDLGRECLNEYLCFSGKEDPCREALFQAIGSYLVVDRGSGIVATRSLLEVALEIDDWDILKRIRHLGTGCPFGMSYEVQPQDQAVTEEERMEMSQFFSDWDEERLGAKLIDLSIVGQGNGS